MANIIKEGLLTLMSEKCYDNYFVDFNFFDGNIFFLVHVILSYEPYQLSCVSNLVFTPYSCVLENAGEQSVGPGHHCWINTG